MIVKALFLSSLKDENFLEIKKALKEFFPLEEKKKDDYIFFSLKGAIGKIILYKTKKLLFYLKEEKDLEVIFNRLKDYLYPKEFNNYDFIIGADESGKGDTFGGLAVGVAGVNKEIYAKLLFLGVVDSKLLKNKNTFNIIRQLKNLNFPYKIKYLSPYFYNRFFEHFKNSLKILDYLYKLAFLEFFKKYGNIFKNKKILIILDAYRPIFQLKKIYFPLWTKIEKIYFLSIDFKVEPKAEKYLPVALASILARAAFLKDFKSIKNNLNLDFLPLGSSHKKIDKILSSIKREYLKNVAKVHFSNVKKYLG